MATSLRFEARGFKLVALKMATPSTEHLEQHYADLKGKKFFPGLIKYMSSGPVVCMVWEGLDAVKTGRKMLGETRPLDSAPGTIRGDFCLDRRYATVVTQLNLLTLKSNYGSVRN